MTVNLSLYATLVFDCDGVVLNSNRLKTEAFRTVTLPWGRSAADEMVAYHTENGGISRYVKFQHFLEKIAPKYETPAQSGPAKPNLTQLLERYAMTVRKGLMTCDMGSELEALRAESRARWLIVSGGDQEELREVFEDRGLAHYFDCGIFGSPDSKPEILAREHEEGNIRDPAIFLGDSKFDYECARACGLDFLFLHGWSEVADWRAFVSEHGLISTSAISDCLVR